MILQSRELSLLSSDEISPSELGWTALEAALKKEGILAGAGMPARSRPIVSPSTLPAWTRIAAAIVVFALGGAAGWGVRGGIASSLDSTGMEVLTPVAVSPDGGASNFPPEVHDPVEGRAEGAPSEANLAAELVPPVPETATQASQTTARPGGAESSPESARTVAAQSVVAPVPEVSEPTAMSIATFLADAPIRTVSLSDAEKMVQVTEMLYSEALVNYRNQLIEAGFESEGDPVSRYVALGNVLAITEEAVRLAPADPFLNGLLINTLVERDAVGRRMVAFASDP
jgi:hypothetical protein